MTVQIMRVLDDCSRAEVLTVLTSVFAQMNLPQIPIQMIGNMAKVMNCNEVVITEDGEGWNLSFRVANDSHVIRAHQGESKYPSPEDLNDEWEAEEYHEEENLPDPSSPSNPELEAIEKESIRRALFRNHGSRKKAAEDLHISERTLYRKIEKYELMKEVRK